MLRARNHLIESQSDIEKMQIISDQGQYFLRSLFPGEREIFALEVLRNIPKFYDEIDETFVNHILMSDSQGRDLTGYFSVRKKVWVLTHKKSSAMCAFTVATEKRGGSVKFGPTVVLPEYRGRGLYPIMISLAEQLYSLHGFRKRYCTCPEEYTKIRLTLSKRGHMVEAILRSHFRTSSNELVIGKLLVARSEPLEIPIVRLSLGEVTISSAHLGYEDLSKYLLIHMPPFYSEIDAEFVEAVFQAQNRFEVGDYSAKGKKVFSVREKSTNELIGVAITTPKRGGAVKIGPCLLTGDLSSTGAILAEIETFYRNLERRRLYTHIPVQDLGLIQFLETHNYKIEGYLREPYKPGVDMVAFGKLLF